MVVLNLHWKSFKCVVKVTWGIVQGTAGDTGFAWASVGELVLLLKKNNKNNLLLS